MPRENRVITFGADEALRALRQFAAKRKIAFHKKRAAEHARRYS